MSEQKLTAFERKVVGGLAHKAGLAATLLDAWANLPKDSVQSARSLIDDAQLGITEENATRELLDLSVGLGLVDAVTCRLASASARLHSSSRPPLSIDTELVDGSGWKLF